MTAAGQQDPATSNSDVTVAMFQMQQMIGLLEVMKLVKVTAVHGGGGAIARAGTVDVQLLVSQLDGALNATPQGVVYGLPWWRLQGGGSAVVCDPVVGDYGYVICADRDISNVKRAAESGGSLETTPGSLRKFSISDGIYVGGLLNGAPTQWLAFTSSGIEWHDSNGNVLKSIPAGFEMTPAAGGVFKVNGTIRATGGIIAGFGTADQVGLQTHGHPALNAPPTPGS